MHEKEVLETKELSVENLQARYQSLLTTAVSPKNILHFFDDALQEIEAIADIAIKNYTELHPEDTSWGNELEDKSFASLGLENIDETLGVLARKKDEVYEIVRYIQTQIPLDETVFVPPQPGEFALKQGLGEGVKKQLIPRLLTLMYILEHDLQIPQDYSLAEGSVTDTMMRKHPYFRVDIPSLSRRVYICDEEGNATYLFDTDKVAIKAEATDVLNKDDFSKMIERDQSSGKKIIQSSLWRENIIASLTQTFDEKKKVQSIESVLQPFGPVSDFTEVLRPEGWETASSLDTLGYGNAKSIRRYAESYREEHPEWFTIYQPLHGNSCWHYAPPLVEILETEFGERKKQRESFVKKKEGWESAASLYVIGVADYDTILDFVALFQKNNPESSDIELQLAPRAKTAVDHYSPSLVRVIKDAMHERKERLAQYGERPVGWETFSELSKRLGLGQVKQQKLKSYLENQKVLLPQCCKEFLYQSSKIAEYFSPEIIRDIEAIDTFIVVRRGEKKK